MARIAARAEARAAERAGKTHEGPRSMESRQQQEDAAPKKPVFMTKAQREKQAPVCAALRSRSASAWSPRAHSSRRSTDATRCPAFGRQLEATSTKGTEPTPVPDDAHSAPVAPLAPPLTHAQAGARCREAR